MIIEPQATLLPTIEQFDLAGTRAVTWDDVIERIGKGGWRWIATLGPDGGPQLRPVFSVWTDPVFLLASNGSTRKSRNLDADGRCSLGLQVDDLHITLEGRAVKVRDEAALQRASRAYADTYSWPTTPSDGHLDAPYGAATSGGPPWDVYEITPVTAFAFPTTEHTFRPTRWTFGSARNTSGA